MSMSTMNRVSAFSLLYPGVKSKVFDQNLLSAAASDPSKQQSEEELDDVSDEVDSAPAPAPTPAPLKPSQLSLPGRFPQSSNADGSLPGSPADSPPDSPSDSRNSSPDMSLGGCCFPKADAQLERDTRALLLAFLRSFAGLSLRESSHARALPEMRRVVEELLEKHHLVYQGMIQKLDLDHRGDDVSFVTPVAKNLFSDGHTNWGRIASLLAFGAVVCKRLKDSGKEHCVDGVANQISSYLVTEQEEWLRNNKGWEGFFDFFHIDDTESLVRNALMAFAGFAGIGAGLALLIR